MTTEADDLVARLLTSAVYHEGDDYFADDSGLYEGEPEPHKSREMKQTMSSLLREAASAISRAPSREDVARAIQSASEDGKRRVDLGNGQSIQTYGMSQAIINPDKLEAAILALFNRGEVK